MSQSGRQRQFKLGGRVRRLGFWGCGQVRRMSMRTRLVSAGV
jgi:hypothetical protein